MISIGIMAGLVAMICWGIADFLQAYPIRKLGGLKTMFFSNAFGLLPTIIIMAIYLMSGGVLLSDPLPLAILFMAAFIDLAAIASFYKAFEIGELSITAPISSTFSLITVILAFFLLGESLTFMQIIAVLVIMLGIILTSADLSRLKNIHSVKGVSQAVMAMAMWGIYFFLVGYVTKMLPSSTPASKISLAANIFIFTGIFNSAIMVLYPLLKRAAPSRQDLDTRTTYIFAANLVLYTVAWLAISYGLAQDLVSIVTPVSSLYPALTVILAMIFLKEKLVPNQYIGVLVILAGIFLISL